MTWRSPLFLNAPDICSWLMVNLISAMTYSATEKPTRLFQAHFPGPGMDVEEPVRCVIETQL